jgi:WD40 repeat protein
MTGIGEMYTLAPGHTFTLAGGRDGLLRRLDSEARLESTWLIGKESLTNVALSPDGMLAAVGTAGGELVVVRASSGEILLRDKVHNDSIDSATWFAPDRLITSSRDGTVRFWQVKRCGDQGTLSELFTLKFGGPVRRVALSPNGRTLAVCVHGERAARLWNLERLEEHLGKLGLDAGPLTPRK